MPVKQSYLVVGSRGLLGREIVEAILRDNDPSTIFLASREASQKPTEHNVQLEPFALDVTQKPDLPDGIDTIIHAAGEKSDVGAMDAVNYYGTEMLARTAAKRGVRRFIHISSVGVYGARSATTEIGEDFAQNPKNAYERSKSRGENAVLNVAQEVGMEAIILRPSTVLAVTPGEHYPLLGLARSLKSGRFAWIRDHDPVSNFIGVFDVAAAVAYAARMPVGECRSYILNTPIRLRELVDHIAATTGIPAPTKELPAGPLQVGAWLGDLIEWSTGRSFPLSTSRLSQLTCRTRFSPERLLNGGFKYPHGILETVSILMKRYRAEGLL
jgi:nucleoside-diphosphate-sugar epimerase